MYDRIRWKIIQANYSYIKLLNQEKGVMKVKIPVALLLAICFTSIVFAKCPYDGLWYMPSPSWELEADT